MLEDVKAKKDIKIDDITVLNNISVAADKKEETKEEVKQEPVVTETKEEAPVVEETKEEEKVVAPEISAPEIKVEEPPKDEAPVIPIPIINVPEVDVPSVDIPTANIDVPTNDVNIPLFGNEPSTESSFQQETSNNTYGFNNDYQSNEDYDTNSIENRYIKDLNSLVMKMSNDVRTEITDEFIKVLNKCAEGFELVNRLAQGPSTLWVTINETLQVINEEKDKLQNDSSYKDDEEVRSFNRVA